MEKRKNSLCATKLCRFCLTQDNTLSSIYERNTSKKNIVSLSLKILSAVSIEVYPSDRMPSYICERCKFFMDKFYDFTQICRRADENILHFIQSGTELETVEWPSSLLKLYSKSIEPKTGVLKTVVQGGATVEVTQPDASESDDDDQVINIKIEDGSDEETKGPACIKVMTSENKLKQGYAGLKKISPEKSISCKICKKRFMKSHHYQRHLRLKHRDILKTGRGRFADQFQCEQCDCCFSTQDELIYHSAIHATQNLTCPLCQEKFHDVDGVTAHIKTHVNGTEFMCDLCELVFTSKEKLDNHITIAHEDEMRNEGLGDESSMDMEGQDDEDEAGIHVKEQDGEMVVEIKKPNEFLKRDAEDKPDTVSEESEQEAIADLSEETFAVLKKNITPTGNTEVIITTTNPATKTASQIQSAAILKKAEEIKRKAIQQAAEAPPAKKDKPARIESSNTSDKSLRLLEKELQELKRTNNRTEATKTPIKTIEQMRSKRLQLHTSTPKPRMVEERKTPSYSKSQVIEKKSIERRVITKENKEPKEERDGRICFTSVKEEREAKESPKVVKNGSSDKTPTDEGSVRRSTRPSKIKDYAKMIRDKSQDDDDDTEDSEDEEYLQEEKVQEVRCRGRPSLKKTSPALVAAAACTPATGQKKRGRPRKVPPTVNTPTTTKKQEADDENDDKSEKSEEKASDTPSDTVSVNDEEKPGLLVSPSGQTLKKVPVKSLPPGVKPLPLPISARPKGELCEMQIGKKIVKVQKIVMTKAEVEAMTKKGLVEMKDGTMVLKQGIKIPTSNASTLKPSVEGDEETPRESPVVKALPAPTRCDLDED